MPPYKVRGTQERSRLQHGIDQLEDVYQDLDVFVHGSSEAPTWGTWLSTFRAGLDQIKADAAILDGGNVRSLSI